MGKELRQLILAIDLHSASCAEFCLWVSLCDRESWRLQAAGGTGLSYHTPEAKAAGFEVKQEQKAARGCAVAVPGQGAVVSVGFPVPLHLPRVLGV